MERRNGHIVKWSLLSVKETLAPSLNENSSSVFRGFSLKSSYHSDGFQLQWSSGSHDNDFSDIAAILCILKCPSVKVILNSSEYSTSLSGFINPAQKKIKKGENAIKF